jgi:Lrp/AsnC family transcriptional regulator, leucine-responsive regulatory protein
MATDVPPAIDDIDRRIIRELSADGRLSVRELAERVSLSTSATSERMRRLERRRLITGYRAVLSPLATGRPLDAVIGVRAQPGADRSALEAWFGSQACIVEAVHLTGPDDYLLRVRCRDAAELDVVLMAMKSDAGVAETQTRIVLRAVPVDPAVV